MLISSSSSSSSLTLLSLLSLLALMASSSSSHGTRFALASAIKWVLVAVCVILCQSFSPCAAAAAAEDPYGGEMTALQKHVAFFDRNKDGVIYPWETYQGFRAIGCGVALSTASAAFINGFLSPKTSIGKFPSPRLPIYVKNIHKGKHGSDSGAYDAEGRFVPEKFEEIFKKHARTHPNALTADELQEMLQANQEPNDSKGRIASWTEWKLLYSLCKDKDGLLQKETVRAVYDGSLFYQMEKERTSRNKA